MNQAPPQPGLTHSPIRPAGRQPRPMAAAVSLGVIALIILLDYLLTPLQILLVTPYMIPLFTLAWFFGWWPGCIAVLVCGLINFLIDLSFAHTFANPLGVHIISAAQFILYLIGVRVIANVQPLIEYASRGEVWRAVYRPRRIGRRFVTVPVWLHDSYVKEAAFQPSDIVLLMDPGMAFGTGSHPTTQMCLELLETYLRPDDRVFDLGCGTGILAMAAAKLGAQAVLAADIDPQAVQAARENAKLNGVADKIEIRLGSLASVISPAPDSSPNSNSNSPVFEITIANILADIIVELLGTGLANTISPGGVMLLSGIRTEQAEAVMNALTTAGLSLIEKRGFDEWVAIAARKN